MRLFTETDFIGLSTAHPWAKHFHVIAYKSGATSVLPLAFFRNWLDQDITPLDFVHLHIGHCSGFGVGSIAKYDSEQQCLRAGRFVSGGLRLKFLLNGQHETRTIATYMFAANLGEQFQQPPTPQYGDTILKNDIWIGDEAMFLGGCVIENGCVIAARALVPPNFKSEPYGIYGGVPARLIRFRFPDELRSALEKLAWWEMPLDWIRRQNAAFLTRLDQLDPCAALDLVASLNEQKEEHMRSAAVNAETDVARPPDGGIPRPSGAL